MHVNDVAIIVSVEVEKNAILEGLNGAPGFDVYVSGVGPVDAAIQTTTALSKKKYKAVINMGIAGGFIGRTTISDVVVASSIVIADLGTETETGFESVDKLGFGTTEISIESTLVTRVCDTLQKHNIHYRLGDILTLSTVTGTADTAIRLSTRFPEAAAEAMEGFGVARSAQKAGIPVIEIRAISNAIGPRDREAWKIKEALVSLQKVSSILPEVFS
ncbi:futalosine hydrolase [Bacillus alkalicellulosilyticus]|uniref:futalosine hydrolase n=1 Tax=Alkalihalobacterium alkalicellulosilyticum TaxID=1912214 RepID=UPI000996F53C|nr:futalosine hydrolase [Bacillus alkalicellulosilyticus]